jgi:hypothetical protein
MQQLSAKPQSPSSAAATADDTVINLFHMELFHNFQTNVTDTLSLQKIWPQVIQWSVHEPFIMSAILCLSATHLAISHPQPSRYSRSALQLWTKSASLMRDKLSRPIETDSVEKLIGASILMQYIAWSHIEFLDEQQHYSSRSHSSSCINISQDPLFNLSSGVKDLYFEAFPALWGSHSAFLSTGLYSPRLVIEQTLEEHGLNPGAYVAFFTKIWNDPHFRDSSTSSLEQKDQPPSLPSSSSLDKFEVFLNSGRAHGPQSLQERLSSMVGVFRILSGCTINDSPPHLPEEHDGRTVPPYTVSPSPPSQQDLSDAQRTAFQFVSRGVSIAMCLASIISTSAISSDSGEKTSSTALTQLQPDIERYLFSLPIICIGTFRDLAFQGDARALVVLLHFYRATQILLTGARGWWAHERCRVMQNLIWRHLRAKGLDAYAQVPGWVGTITASGVE